MADNTIKIEVVAKDLASSILKNVRDEITKTGDASKFAQKPTNDFGFSLGNVASVAGGMIAANILGKVANGFMDLATAIPNFALGALDLAKGLQANSTSLRLLIGDTEKTKVLFKELSEFARNTPFNLIDLQGYTKQLLAANFQTEEIVDTLDALGDIASAVGFDKLPNLIYAISQTRVAAKFAGNDLLQFRNAGVNVDTVFRDKLGLSVDEVNKKIEEGSMTYKQAEDALLSLGRAGGKFDNQMVEISQNTLVGLESNLGDVRDSFLALVGGFDVSTGELVEGGFLDQVQQGVRDLMEYLSSPEGTAALQGIGTGLSEIFGNIGQFAIKLVTEFLPSLLSFVQNDLVPGIKDFTEGFKTEFPKIKQFIVDVISVGRDLVSVFTTFFNLLRDIGNSVTNVLNLMGMATPAAQRSNALDAAADDLAYKNAGLAKLRTGQSSLPTQSVVTTPKASSFSYTPIPTGGNGLSLGRFASGTDYSMGGLSLVGERGPELMYVPRGASITPARETSNMTSNRTITINNQFTNTEVDERALTNLLAFQIGNV